MPYTSQPWLPLATGRLSGKKKSECGLKLQGSRTNHAHLREGRGKRRLLLAGHVPVTYPRPMNFSATFVHYLMNFSRHESVLSRMKRKTWKGFQVYSYIQSGSVLLGLQTGGLRRQVASADRWPPQTGGLRRQVASADRWPPQTGGLCRQVASARRVPPFRIGI